MLAGVAHGAFDNDAEALAGIRELFSFLPLSNREKSPIIDCQDSWQRDCPGLDTVVPLESTAAYDMMDVITGVCTHK